METAQKQTMLNATLHWTLCHLSTAWLSKCVLNVIIRAGLWSGEIIWECNKPKRHSRIHIHESKLGHKYSLDSICQENQIFSSKQRGEKAEGNFSSSAPAPFIESSLFTLIIQSPDAMEELKMGSKDFSGLKKKKKKYLFKPKTLSASAEFQDYRNNGMAMQGAAGLKWPVSAPKLPLLLFSQRDSQQSGFLMGCIFLKSAIHSEGRANNSPVHTVKKFVISFQIIFYLLLPICTVLASVVHSLISSW